MPDASLRYAAMASLQTLPSDQRAVLELVLRRGRSYDQIATMLGIDRAGVRARALAALDALGPDTPVSDERRHLITDYLLGALPRRVAEEVRSLLAQAAPERAWARVVASELEPIASSPLPEIPVGGAPRGAAPAAERAAAPERSGAPAAAGVPAPPRERARAERGRPARSPISPPLPRRPSSRRGGAVLLGLGGAVAIAVVVVLILNLTASSSKPAPHAATLGTHPASTPSTTTTTAGNGAQILSQLNLNPPNGGKAKGAAFVIRVSGRLGLEIRAAGLVPNSTHPPNAYAVWLFNTPSDSHILGFVNPGVGQNGSFETIGPLPANAAHYHKLLVTLETTSNPKTPGTIILQAPLTGVPSS
jgi:hypothetical protein